MAGTRAPNYLVAALVMPANLFALLGGALASAITGDWLPLAAAGGASVAYLAMLSTLPSFRRRVRANFEAQSSSLVASPDELEALLGELAPSQREHYRSLKALRDGIFERYQALPGGRVLAPSSARHLDGLLTSFLRLVSTLNGYRQFLGATDRKGLEAELAALEQELAQEGSGRLFEVKARRAELLRKRVQRYGQADESREIISHQLASIEDALLLTHERSIAWRDPELVSHQLDQLTTEVAATEETVREMESFMRVTEEFSSMGSPPGERAKVR
jgi:small-conductance mechanosensitive channel